MTGRSTVTTFATELRRLYQAAGSPKPATLVRHAAAQRPPVPLTTTCVSDWLAGRSVPSDPAVVRFLVGHLQPAAAGHPDCREHDLDWWAGLHEWAWEQAPAPGWVIGYLEEADALALDVRPAIAGPAAPDIPEIPVLPPYLPRAHDTALRQELAAAETGGRIVMPRGGPATGTTRACWEAIRAVLPGWRVWRPLAPHQPETLVEALRDGRLAPRTVIWLDDAHAYLGYDGTGEEVAVALERLLADGDTPMAVVGSLWPERWDALTDPRSVSHAAARRLLRRCRDIVVPSVFTPRELVGSADRIGSDPRLLAAVESGVGRIVQYLAGVPAIIDRYEHADPSAQAVMHAAIDACRLSRWTTLPREFLCRAAPGYLDGNSRPPLDPPAIYPSPDRPSGPPLASSPGAPPDRTSGPPLTAPPGAPPDPAYRAPSDPAFDGALRYLTGSDVGAAGPLTRCDPRPGDTDPTVRYRLAGCLLQTGGVERAGVFPPSSFWDAVVGTTHDPHVLRDFGRQAAKRARYPRAAQLYRRATELGDPRAMCELARLSDRSGDAEAAEALYRRAIEHGGTDALYDLAVMREHAGDLVTAQTLYLQAADHGNTDALHHLAQLREQAGDEAAAQALYRRAADRGNALALHDLAVLREQAGDTAEAEALAEQAADQGSTDALYDLAVMREQAGNEAAAQALYLRAADHGNTLALHTLALQRERAGDTEAAEALADRAADRGSTLALRDLAALRERIGDTAGARTMYRRAADHDDVDALRDLAALRERTGDRAGAMSEYQHATDLDGTFPLREFALGGADRHDPAGDEVPHRRAEALYRRAADRGDAFALLFLASLRERAGDSTGAGRLWRFGLTDDGEPATSLD